MSLLATLKPNKGAKKKMKRVGRGESSGHGKTSGKGNKGQKARSSRHIAVGFEGGQMPLHRRSPKWGFNRSQKMAYQIVNISDLNEKFQSGEAANPETLSARGLVKKRQLPIKILGNGKLEKSLNVSAQAFSKGAEKIITQAKGVVTILKNQRNGSVTK